MTFDGSERPRTAPQDVITTVGEDADAMCAMRRHVSAVPFETIMSVTTRIF